MNYETSLNLSSNDLNRYVKTEQVDSWQLGSDIQQLREESTLPRQISNFRQKLRKIGIEPTVGNTALFGADHILVGEYQLPAYRFFESGGTFIDTQKMALRRIINAATAATSTVGVAVSSWGFSSESPNPLYGALGIGMQVAANLIENPNKNTLGTIWNQHMQQVLSDNHNLIGMMKNKLAEGFTPEEIAQIGDIGGIIYNTELNTSRIDRSETIAKSFSVALAMASYKSYLLAGITSVLALCAIPIGEIAYRESNLKRRAATRSARSANAKDWRDKLGMDHVRMVQKLNILSNLPRIAQGLTVAASVGFNYSNRNLLSNILGLQFGLEGLNKTLSQQRSREDTRRNTELASTVINLISSEHTILTQNRWEEHVRKNGINTLEDVPFQDGVCIRNFKSVLPNGKHTELPPVSLDVEKGEVTVIKFKSGTGKSTFFSGPLHFSEHTGDLFFVKNGIAEDVHNLKSARELDKKIQIISSNMLGSTNAIVDEFRSTFAAEYQTEEVDKRDQFLMQNATQVSDALLLAEINKLESKDYKNSFYPLRMLEPLKKLRAARLIYVNNLLQNAGGNLSVNGVTAESVIGDGSINGGLSNGQRQRLSMLVASEIVRTAPDLQVLIFDEPLDKLDKEENLLIQLEAIRSIQYSLNAPAIIVISHDHISELKEYTSATLHDFSANS